MSTSTLIGISSSTLFQDRISDITQNNLIINSVFASSDETGDDSNGVGDEDQGGSDETEDITTLNPSLSALPDSEECPSGSPSGCFVIISPGSGSAQCPEGTQFVQNTPRGPTGTMCAPILQENQNNLAGGTRAE
jgi:hypothetical protein